MATNQPLTIFAGDTLSIPVTCTRSDGVTAIDLTGATIKFGIATSPGILKTVGSGITVTGAAAGKATITVSPADLAAFAGSVYDWDLVVIEASGVRSTLAYGKLTVQDHVTKT